jgi:hypothetical protein
LAARIQETREEQLSDAEMLRAGVCLAPLVVLGADYFLTEVGATKFDLPEEFVPDGAHL